jgi:hypothetical protein
MATGPGRALRVIGCESPLVRDPLSEQQAVSAVSGALSDPVRLRLDSTGATVAAGGTR